ncbi:hypothetical protein RFI_16622 [Reticulomyxa filosa]|uniref:Uncharacterized protein n=1 Tax=Reticulomyxa filosa TaxID=46433 RepID=X6N2U4_RETFI|nr:hypothetical protein RFI_16622 [Reticulomyxa filosa]|eukprot:ETO20595.1 hypothetical protein RFI_16622 [Reticulomyxa filosa]
MLNNYFCHCYIKENKKKAKEKRSHKNRKKIIIHMQPPKLKKEWIGNLTNYAAFLALLTFTTKLGHNIAAKKIGPQMSAGTLTGLSLLTCYFCQKHFPLLSWDWCLYLLIRSLYSLYKHAVPAELVFDSKYVYCAILPFLSYMCTFNLQYVPLSYWNFYASGT